MPYIDKHKTFIKRGCPTDSPLPLLTVCKKRYENVLNPFKHSTHAQDVLYMGEMFLTTFDNDRLVIFIMVRHTVAIGFHSAVH